MRVLVCGSRDWTDRNAIWCVLNGYRADGLPMTVIHGSARGADSIAGYWATVNGVDFQQFMADWKQHGKAAGPIRNAQMLANGEPDVVWAFVTKPLERSRGTADMVSRAVKAGIPAYVVRGHGAVIEEEG